MTTKIPPTWLDKFFFENVIKFHTKDSSSIVNDFTISSGSNSGENFASEMFRAVINYSTTKAESSSISVIIKLKPKESGDIGAERMFIAEMKMYSETLIDINRLLLKATSANDGDDDVILFPR